MSSTTSTTRKIRQPRHIRQGIDPEAKAKLAQVVVNGRLAELVRKDATHFLRRQSCENWLRAIEACALPMGPAMLPKTVRNIKAWRKLTPKQQQVIKDKAVTEARAAAAEAKANRPTKKQEG